MELYLDIAQWCEHDVIFAALIATHGIIWVACITHKPVQLRPPAKSAGEDNRKHWKCGKAPNSIVDAELCSSSNCMDMGH